MKMMKTISVMMEMMMMKIWKMVFSFLIKNIHNILFYKIEDDNYEDDDDDDDVVADDDDEENEDEEEEEKNAQKAKKTKK